MTDRIPITPEVLVAKLDGLREMLTERDRRMDERDRRIDERFAQETAAKDLIASNLIEYKREANEWRGAVKDAQSHVSVNTLFVMAAGILIALVLGALGLFLK